jgi:hypothetical protein
MTLSSQINVIVLYSGQNFIGIGGTKTYIVRNLINRKSIIDDFVDQIIANSDFCLIRIIHQIWNTGKIVPENAVFDFRMHKFISFCRNENVFDKNPEELKIFMNLHRKLLQTLCSGIIYRFRMYIRIDRFK